MPDANGQQPSPAGGFPDSAAEGAVVRLARFALARGEPFAGGGNRPIRLADPDVWWFVARGTVDVFAVREQDRGSFADFKHLLRADSGRLLFHADRGPNVLVAKGLPGSELRRVPREALLAADADGAIVEQVDAWVADISAAVARDVTYRPHTERFITAGVTTDLNAGDVVSATRGVVWTSSADSGLAFLGTEEPDRTGSGFVPVAPGSWIEVSRAIRLRAASSRELHRQGHLLAALAEFHHLSLGADDLNRKLLLADAVNLRTAQARHRRESEGAARRRLVGMVDVRSHQREAHGTALQDALALIGRHEGIRFRPPPASHRRRDSGDEPDPRLDRILATSGVRGREIAINARDRWWLGDSGAMLAFRREDGAPLALLPGRWGRYRMVDPASGRSEPVDARRAASLRPDAVFFYQPLRNARTSGARDLARVAFHRWTGDVPRLLLAGLLAGFATLAPAVLFGIFVDQVAPAGSEGMLFLLVAGMLLLALTAALFEMLEGTAVMRLEGRVATRVTAALWDRLLDLPAAFFRKFTAGDLAARAMAFHDLRDRVAGGVIRALLSAIFLLPTFVLLFILNVAMGWVGLVFGLGALAVTVTLGLKQAPHHRRALAASRSLTGVLLQLIRAAPKLRSTGKEWTAFIQWAQGYREQRRNEMNVGVLNEHLVAFTAAAPLLATATLFAAALVEGTEALSTGTFVTVYAAYMVFLSAIAALGRCVAGVAVIVPAGEQVSPILKASPRGAPDDTAAPELRGEVRLENVSFRYAQDGPLVLRHVSMAVQPGEFVALVGGSGAGKSTVLRIVLGMEKTLSGVVYYDGHNLDRLNRRVVRRHVGMVVQDASLRSGTVYSNIVGMVTEMTLDDAWRAARLAAVDGDIMAMPMGMFTPVTGSTAQFSGGQIQRIMLAAALVSGPRILLLDEATNWLDANTQARVMARIEQLAVTRIVSAHRLSTIRKADRIYVLDEGQVVQQGTFAQLIEVQGVFRDLARRQLT